MMIWIKLMARLQKITPNKIILEHAFKVCFSQKHSNQNTPTKQSLQNLQINHAASIFHSSLFCKISLISFHPRSL